MRRADLLLSLTLVLGACKSHDTDKPAAPPPDMTAKATTAPAPPRPAVDAKGFDRTCQAATDCVVVKPAACDPCGCPSDAIASKEMAKFDEVAGKLNCPPPDLTVKCAPCEARVAACESGQCVAVAKK